MEGEGVGLVPHPLGLCSNRTLSTSLSLRLCGTIGSKAQVVRMQSVERLHPRHWCLAPCICPFA
jgi:hypothetical protein